MANVIVRICNNTDEPIHPMGNGSVIVKKGALVGFINPIHPRSTDAVFQVMQVMGQDGTEGEVNMYIGHPSTNHIMKIQFKTQTTGRNKFCVVTSGLNYHRIVAPPSLAPAINIDVTFTLSYLNERAEQLFKAEQKEAQDAHESFAAPQEIPPTSSFDDGFCVIQPALPHNQGGAVVATLPPAPQGYEGAKDETVQVPSPTTPVTNCGSASSASCAHPSNSSMVSGISRYPVGLGDS